MLLLLWKHLSQSLSEKKKTKDLQGSFFFVNQSGSVSLRSFGIIIKNSGAEPFGLETGCRAEPCVLETGNCGPCVLESSNVKHFALEAGKGELCVSEDSCVEH